MTNLMMQRRKRWRNAPRRRKNPLMWMCSRKGKAWSRMKSPTDVLPGLLPSRLTRITVTVTKVKDTAKNRPICRKMYPWTSLLTDLLYPVCFQSRRFRLYFLHCQLPLSIAYRAGAWPPTTLPPPAHQDPSDQSVMKIHHSFDPRHTAPVILAHMRIRVLRHFEDSHRPSVLFRSSVLKMHGTTSLLRRMLKV